MTCIFIEFQFLLVGIKKKACIQENCVWKKNASITSLPGKYHESFSLIDIACKSISEHIFLLFNVSSIC